MSASFDIGAGVYCRTKRSDGNWGTPKRLDLKNYWFTVLGVGKIAIDSYGDYPINDLHSSNQMKLCFLHWYGTGAPPYAGSSPYYYVLLMPNLYATTQIAFLYNGTFIRSYNKDTNTWTAWQTIATYIT